MIDYANELVQEIQRLKPTDAIAIKVDGEFEIKSVIYDGNHISIECFEGIQSYMNRISELEEENCDLEQDREDLECERDDLESELQDLQKAHEDMIEQRDFHLNRVNVLEARNKKLKEEIKNLKRQIEANNSDTLF